MPLPVLIVNGPNLDMLGRREPDIYGTRTLADLEASCRVAAKQLGLEIEWFQSNIEGELVAKLHEAIEDFSGVIINAGAYTHTSIAILDALMMLKVPVIEVHLSNIFRRESFRHHSYVSMAARGIICGFGEQSYILAMKAISSCGTAQG